MTDIRVVLVELDELAEDLSLVADEVVDKMRPVVSKGALNIKRDWRASWQDLGPHITDLPRKVTYDLDVEGTGISAEVGPDKDLGGQAPLGNLIEYGSANSAPHPAGAHALEAEAPRFEQAVADAAEKLLDGRG